MLSLVVFVTMATIAVVASPTPSPKICSMSGWYSSAAAAVASPQTSPMGTITTSGVTVTNAARYPDNQECYLAIVPTGVETSFKLSFSTFNMEKDSDFLHIYDGTSTSSTNLLTASGSSLEAIPGQAVQSSGTSMLLKFVSDDTFYEEGVSRDDLQQGFYAYYVTDGTVSSRVLSALHCTPTR